MIKQNGKVVTHVIRPDPPEYALIKEVAVKLKKDKSGYYRHAGKWEVEYKYSHNQLVVKAPHLPHLNNLPIIKTSKKIWEEQNKHYL